LEAEATVPTRHGSFRFLVFRHATDPAKEHVAVICGDITGDDVLVRVHSECMTSEVFGSLKCDCAEQLEHALEAIGREGRGVVLYLRQEGRSIGLANKIRAYALQAQGADTVDANRALLLPDDARRYDAAAAILGRLGVRSVRERVSAVVDAHPLSHGYLATKQARMRHVFP
jgi:GTP cyclohydrolase II